jgi:hypothetical protein
MTPVLRYSEEPGSIADKTRLFGVPQNRRLKMFIVPAPHTRATARSPSTAALAAP